MRRLVVLLFMFLLVGSSFADEPITYEEIPLQVSIVDPDANEAPIRRSPVHVPTIGIDGYTLYFITPCDGCTLRLIDEDGEMVINMITSEDYSTINLPSYMFGEYEIQIIRGNYCFYGYINI